MKNNHLFFRQHIFCSILFILFFIIIFSCTKNNNNTNTPKIEDTNQKVTIGFSIDTLAIERWQRDLDIFINKAKELGADVIVQNAGNSVEEQNKQLMYLLESNVDAIVIVAKKADSLVDSITKIKSKNIPVIAYDRLILNSEIDMYMSINSKSVGTLMAKGLMNITQNKNFTCILGPEEDFNMHLIKQGILEAIKHTGYYIQNFFYTDDWNYDLSYKHMTKLIATGKIPDAIICGNDSVASSVIQALNDYSQEKKVYICGQDADILACQNIVEDKQDFTIYKPITQLAELAAEFCVRFGSKENPQDITKNLPTINNGIQNVPVLWLEPSIVNKENLDEMIIDTGFHTKGEIYK